MTEQTFEGTGNQNLSETQPDETGKNITEQDTGLILEQWKSENEKLAKEKEDWQKKFSDSARGAQELLEEKKLLQAKLDELSSKTFSDEEYSKVIPNWDYMTEGEKLANSRALKLEKQLASHNALINKIAEEKAWEADFGKTIKNNPVLKDYQDEFKEYAYRNIDVKNLDILAKAFLSDKQPSEPAKPKLGLEKPVGGTRTPSSGKMTPDEIESLRTNDYKRYKDLLLKGKI